MISGAFGSGLLAGLLSSLIFHPIDVIKIRSQVDEASFSKRQTLYQRVRMVYGDAGIRGFYRGLAPACLASSVAWGFYFLFYEPLKTNLADWNQNLVLEGVVVDDSFQTQSQHTQRFTNATVHFTASTFAGGLTVLLTNPIWVIKTRMELQQSNAEHYRGTIDAFRQIRHQEGIAGLYRGILPALILTSNGAIQFMIYEDLKARLEVFHEGTPSWAEIFAVGVVSKVVATTVTYPYQVSAGVSFFACSPVAE